MRVLRILVALGLLTALAGCAGVDAKRAAMPGGNEIDTQKMLTVNRWALDHGATVIWVNYPLRKIGDGG